MFFIEILRYFTGYIHFSATGGFGERFINLCSVHNIPLWNIVYHDDFFEACTSCEGYLKIAVCARNSGVKIRRLHSVGIPFILSRLKSHYGLLIGLIFFIVCFSVLSGRVWIIEIDGNKTIPDDVIYSAVEEAGLKKGDKTDELNVVGLSLNLCKSNNRLAWAAINVSGCCVYIDITEADTTPRINSTDGAYNIVATKDAQLVVVESYRGTAQVKNFSSVMKGDILISGTVDNKNETTSFLHASGYIVGRTTSNITQSVATTLKTVVTEKIKTVYHLNFFDKTLTLGITPNKYSQKFSQTKELTFSSKALPLSVTTDSYYSVSYKNKTPSEQIIKKILINSFMNDVADFSEGKQIVDVTLSFNQTKNFAEINSAFICYENIGAEAPLETEFIEQNDNKKPPDT